MSCSVSSLYCKNPVRKTGEWYYSMNCHLMLTRNIHLYDKINLSYLFTKHLYVTAAFDICKCIRKQDGLNQDMSIKTYISPFKSQLNWYVGQRTVLSISPLSDCFKCFKGFCNGLYKRRSAHICTEMGFLLTNTALIETFRWIYVTGILQIQ